MWITELRTNTITADSRIGAHSDSEVRCSIGTPGFLFGVLAAPPWASRRLYAQTRFRPKGRPRHPDTLGFALAAGEPNGAAGTCRMGDSGDRQERASSCLPRPGRQAPDGTIRAFSTLRW